MSIWSSQDVARDFVRRQADGLDITQVAEQVAEAARRKRETAAGTRHVLQHDVDGLVAADPHRLAATWAAKHTEWERIHTLLEVSGRAVYEPSDDATGTQWARERQEYRQQRLDAFAAHQEQRRQDRSAVTLQLRLTADQAAALHRAAARSGLTPEQVLAHLAAHVETSPDGTLSVPGHDCA
ncbi:hypothetical protein ACIGHB_29670 [Streptomyces sp. NPDC085460]|uniref:hypothetical protein n=1 Tax=Streptomyces sp. NPDC085460 TaxID=3365723 RepID=UPI0037D00F06